MPTIFTWRAEVTDAATIARVVYALLDERRAGRPPGARNRQARRTGGPSGCRRRRGDRLKTTSHFEANAQRSAWAASSEKSRSFMFAPS